MVVSWSMDVEARPPTLFETASNTVLQPGLPLQEPNTPANATAAMFWLIAVVATSDTECAWLAPLPLITHTYVVEQPVSPSKPLLRPSLYTLYLLPRPLV
jgi:hypothetical protein